MKTIQTSLKSHGIIACLLLLSSAMMGQTTMEKNDEGKNIFAKNTTVLNRQFAINTPISEMPVHSAKKFIYQDILGTWDVLDTTEESPMLSFQFIDSSHLSTIVMGFGLPANYLANTTDSEFTSLFIEAVSGAGKKCFDQVLIRLANENTLQMQFVARIDASQLQETMSTPVQWDEKETERTTGILVRRK